MRQAYALDRLCQRIRVCSLWSKLPPGTLPCPAAAKRRGEHIMFEWLIPRLIVGTVKLTAFLIRKLVTAGKPQP